MTTPPDNAATYRMVRRAPGASTSKVTVGPFQVGHDFIVIAGPCAVESEAQIQACAQKAKSFGAHVLRGGAFKPRTSPYSFQGLGMEGVSMLHAAGEANGLPTVSEVESPRDIAAMAHHIAMLQVGSRNMQNFALLEELGDCRCPVLLKRGMSATIEEWLFAAEYLLLRGNSNVILCERGIRTFEPQTRNTLDLAGMALAKRLSHLPVVVDPSHATGDRELVIPMALAAAAAGADGLMVEIHPQPDTALCDGHQALSFTQFETLMASLKPLLSSVGRRLAEPS